MSGLDLTQIAPLTEAEAGAIFNAPTASDKYIAAMEELKTLPFVDGHIIEDIQGYIRWLLQALNNANEKYDGLDRYLNRHHDMGQ